MKRKFYLEKKMLDEITKSIDRYNIAQGRVVVRYNWKLDKDLDDTYELSIIPEDLLDMYNIGRMSMIK